MTKCRERELKGRFDLLQAKTEITIPFHVVFEFPQVAIMEEFEKLRKDGVFDFGGGHTAKVNTKRPIGSIYNPNPEGTQTKKVFYIII